MRASFTRLFHTALSCRPVTTANGEQLSLQKTNFGDLQLGFGGQVISVDSTQYNSCKTNPPSTILSTSDMLEHNDVISVIGNSSASGPLAAPVTSQRGVEELARSWVSSNAFWALLASILLFLVLGFYVGKGVRKLLKADQRSFIETEGQQAMRVAEIARMAEEDAAQMRRIEAARAGPPLPPTVRCHTVEMYLLACFLVFWNLVFFWWPCLAHSENCSVAIVQSNAGDIVCDSLCLAESHDREISEFIGCRRYHIHGAGAEKVGHKAVDHSGRCCHPYAVTVKATVQRLLPVRRAAFCGIFEISEASEAAQPAQHHT